MKAVLEENATKTTTARALRFATTNINAKKFHFGMELLDKSRASAYGRTDVHRTLIAPARETG